jgi:hypothetical protein
MSRVILEGSEGNKPLAVSLSEKAADKSPEVVSGLHVRARIATVAGTANKTTPVLFSFSVHNFTCNPLSPISRIFFVQVSQISRGFASGPAGEIPPGESIVKRCWRPGCPAEVPLTLFG